MRQMAGTVVGFPDAAAAAAGRWPVSHSGQLPVRLRTLESLRFNPGTALPALARLSAAGRRSDRDGFRRKGRANGPQLAPLAAFCGIAYGRSTGVPGVRPHSAHDPS